jgi:hypothetical protein
MNNKKLWFENELLRSSAFRSLSKWAMLVYFDLLRKRQMEQVKRAKRSDEWIIKNNGEIVYPYTEAEHKGIGRREFRNAIDELIEKGFLDITHQGSGGRSGDMTKYFIDVRWKDYGTSSFRPAKNPRTKDSRQGRGWTAYHAKNEKSPVTKLIPEQAGSSNNSATPNKNARILSSSKSDIPKGDSKNVTTNNHVEKRLPQQQLLWSNNLDTIL